jgi:Ca2+-transporting ATPase
MLGTSMREIKTEVPRLQAQTRGLVITFAIAGAIASILAVVLHGLRYGDWLQALLGGIALGMAMLPEEFPLVLTVFMVMGAWRLSRSRVLTRRASAIETLGAATVLCTDKTGTLTKNSMSVVRLETTAEGCGPGVDGKVIARSAGLSCLLETAALASEPLGHDPMDNALHALAAQVHGVDAMSPPVRTYPLRRTLLAVTRVVSQPGKPMLRIASKGAPEAIARLCRLDATDHARLMERVDALAQGGMRVLAVATGAAQAHTLPDDPAEFPLQLLGLVGFADPLRDEVPAAMRECRQAGVRVVMITGDYPRTAQAIAAEAGFAPGECLTGDELMALSEEQLALRVRGVNVFARITPSQKLRIVGALKANGEVVAMTGDGVNDAPALKAAHIGVAMGGRGTDVAREASSLVLLDDDFGSIVRAIRLGREIYDNLRKAMSYILAIHIPIAGVALLPLITGAPLVLTPVLIALLELLIDPTCSIVFEAERGGPDLMRRPPRRARESIMSARVIWWSSLQGVLALLAVGAVHLHVSGLGLPGGAVRLCVFLALTSASFALVLANRDRSASFDSLFARGNAMLLLSAGATVMLVALLMLLPQLRKFLGVELPGSALVALSVGSGVALLLSLQLLKGLRNRLAAAFR